MEGNAVTFFNYISPILKLGNQWLPNYVQTFS